MVDEIDAHGRRPRQPRDSVGTVDEQRRRAVAGEHFHRAAGPGLAPFRRRDEHRPASGGGAVQRAQEGRRRRAQPAAHVHGAQVATQGQRLRDDAGVLAHGERMRGGGQHHGAGFAGLAHVPRRLHGHRDRVLVPVGHRPLAPGEGAKGGVEPGVGLGDGRSLQAAARQIGTERGDSGQGCSPWTKARGRSRAPEGQGDLVFRPRQGAPPQPAVQAFLPGHREDEREATADRVASHPCAPDHWTMGKAQW